MVEVKEWDGKFYFERRGGVPANLISVGKSLSNIRKDMEE